jgi:hypothetical protein
MERHGVMKRRGFIAKNPQEISTNFQITIENEAPRKVFAK